MIELKRDEIHEGDDNIFYFDGINHYKINVRKIEDIKLKPEGWKNKTWFTEYTLETPSGAIVMQRMPYRLEFVKLFKNEKDISSKVT